MFIDLSVSESYSYMNIYAHQAKGKTAIWLPPWSNLSKGSQMNSRAWVPSFNSWCHFLEPWKPHLTEHTSFSDAVFFCRVFLGSRGRGNMSSSFFALLVGKKRFSRMGKLKAICQESWVSRGQTWVCIVFSFCVYTMKLGIIVRIMRIIIPGGNQFC